MTDFTFIVLTYNHEKYIIDNLESIKQIIIDFGNGIRTDILISDDASSDNTIKIVNDWIEKNDFLFRNTTVLQREKNVGTVQNIFEAVDNCKTEDFKLIAGDDKFNHVDIFAVQEDVNENEVVITPLLPFSEKLDQSFQIKTDKINKAFDIIYKNQKHLKRIERINNFIPAPGAFYGKNILRDKELQKSVMKYRLIEDVPIWNYILFSSKEYRIRIVNSPKCVCYRLNTGVSFQKEKKGLSEYEIELARIKKDFDLKAFKYPKIINPYYLELIIFRLFGNE